MLVDKTTRWPHKVVDSDLERCLSKYFSFLLSFANNLATHGMSAFMYRKIFITHLRSPPSPIISFGFHSPRRLCVQPSRKKSSNYVEYVFDALLVR